MAARSWTCTATSAFRCSAGRRCGNARANVTKGGGMRYVIKSTAIIATVACSGCVVHDNLERNATASSIGESTIVVMGVDQNYQVEINKGYADGNDVSMSSAPGALSVFPQNGYIVGKVSPSKDDEVQVLYMIRPNGYGMFKDSYRPCNGERTATFSALPGRVIYIGDVHFVKENKQLQLVYSYHPDAA